MAALRGTLQGNRGMVSRLGSEKSGIVSELNTWNGVIRTHLEADGTYRVEVDDFHGGRRKLVAEGSVSDAS